jgi:hypothetical protein
VSYTTFIAHFRAKYCTLCYWRKHFGCDFEFGEHKCKNPTALHFLDKYADKLWEPCDQKRTKEDEQ